MNEIFNDQQIIEHESRKLKKRFASPEEKAAVEKAAMQAFLELKKS